MQAAAPRGHSADLTGGWGQATNGPTWKLEDAPCAGRGSKRRTAPATALSRATASRQSGVPLRRPCADRGSYPAGNRRLPAAGRASHLLRSRPQLSRARRGGREQARRGPSLPESADIGYRAVNALTGHKCPIVIPADATGRVQYEAELVAVIGRTARHIREDEVRGHLLGYTIGNDVSERHWQAHDAPSGGLRTQTASRRWAPGSTPNSTLPARKPSCA